MPDVAPPVNTPEHPDPTGWGERGLAAKAQATAMGDIDLARERGLDPDVIEPEEDARQARLEAAGVTVSEPDDEPEPAPPVPKSKKK